MNQQIFKTLRLGDRLKTIFGDGTIVCFEDHTMHRRNVKMWYSSSFSGDGRIVVALDNPANWILSSSTNPHPYMFKSDILAIL
jgi:hypothetical protein